MAQGLQVWDSNGNVLVDTTKRLSFILYSHKITSSAQTWTMKNDLFTTNTAFYIAPTIRPNQRTYEPRITLSVNGDTCTLSTQYIDTAFTTEDILVGVY